MGARLCCAAAECPAPASFEILDAGDLREETAIRFACREHVGALLHHAAHVEEPVNLWEVRLLEGNEPNPG